MPTRWPRGQRCAVSLTYDDALPVHHQMVGPLLTAHGLAGTFYINAHGGFTSDIAPWRALAAQGHELGNHTLFHPCRQVPRANFGWLLPHYDLCDYTVQRWSDEVRIANCLLELVDGRRARSYGSTCGHTTVGPDVHQIALDGPIRQHFVAGRGAATNQFVDPTQPAYATLPCCHGDRAQFVDHRALLEQAMASGAWIIWCTHGVGQGTHPGYQDPDQHEALVEYLGAHRDAIWTAPLVDVARHLQQQPA